MQPLIPAEKRIKVADTLRLLFHYCNIVNLTLGLIVFGVGVSLVLSPLPLPAGKDISAIYGTLLISAVIVILVGMLGIHGCYWVQENRLKLYALSTIAAIMLEAGLGSMAIIKEQSIMDHIDSTLENFRSMNSNHSNMSLLHFRQTQYDTNATYKNIVDNVHTELSCCSFINVSNNISSCHHRISGTPLPGCVETLRDFINIKLTYIRCLAFMLVPIQLFCLGFDLMVLKTLQVTKEYDKLERELSNRKREKRNSMGYTTIGDVENINLQAAYNRVA